MGGQSDRILMVSGNRGIGHINMASGLSLRQLQEADTVWAITPHRHRES